MFASQALLLSYLFLDVIFRKVFFLILPKCSIERVMVVYIFEREGDIFQRTSREKKFNFSAVKFPLKPSKFLCS